ncbi:MAG TPA: DMT family transporter, partial [Candidatus Kryptobacter bacterium]|nr:DMT family transporter [Candidatus Kryptobacter bacterium]
GIYLKDRITLPKIAGTFMAFVGVAVIVLEKGLTIGVSHLKGDFFVFLAVIAWTLYTTLGRKLILRHGAINSTIFTALIGSAMFLPIGVWSSFGYSYSSLSTGQWGEIVYLSLITSIVGYVLWYYALGKIEASRVAVFTNGQPVTTAILAYIFLGQGISLTFAFGAAVTIGGVVVTQLEWKRIRKREA